MRTIFALALVFAIAACSSSGDDAGSVADARPADAAPPDGFVSACFGTGCPRGECASLDGCDAAGYNSGGFDWDDSTEFCGQSASTDLCISFDGTFYHVTCAGPTVVRESCVDGCAFDEIAECAYCAEDDSCAP